MHKRLILLISFVFLLPNNSNAAAWLQPQGSKQFIGTLSAYRSGDYFDGSGHSQSSDINFRKFELNPFLEYGLSDKTTIGGILNVQNLIFKKKDPTESVFDFRQCGTYSNSNVNPVNASIIEADLFFRRKLWQKDNFILSVQPLVKTPCLLITESNIELLRNTADAEMRLLAGYSFKAGNLNKNTPFSGQYHFINSEVAYRKRDSQFSDQIKFDNTLGLRANDELLFLLQSFSTFSNGDEPIRGLVGTNQIYIEEGSFYSTKLQVSGIRQISENVSLQLSMFKDVIGKNSGNGTGAGASIWYGF